MKESKTSNLAIANSGFLTSDQREAPQGWRVRYKHLPTYLLDIDEGEDFCDEQESDTFDEFDGFVRRKSCLIN